MAATAYSHLQFRTEQGILVGEITATQMQGDELADEMRQELLAAIAEHKTNRLVLDFQNVKYLGSAGFRPLLSLYRKLQESNGRMIFINLTPDVEEVFLVTRLLSPIPNSTSPFEKALTLEAAIQTLKDAELPKKG